MSTKNSSDTIGNRTRDLPACSAMPVQRPEVKTELGERTGRKPYKFVNMKIETLLCSAVGTESRECGFRTGVALVSLGFRCKMENMYRPYRR